MQGTSWRRALLATAGAAVLLVTMAVPAHADPPPDVDIPAGSPLAQCVDHAKGKHFQEWVCFGGEITVSKDENGNRAEHTERIAKDEQPGPDDPGQPGDPGQPSDPGRPADPGQPGDPGKPDASAGKPSVALASMTRVVPMKGGDFYDTWCENGTVCSRYVTAYQSETKGNAAYGDQNGVIGTFDVILNTQLSGRTPKWKVTLLWDSGPAIYFKEPNMQCRQKVFTGAISCGGFAMQDFVINSVTYRYPSNTIYGNRLANAADYYSQFKASFAPLGSDYGFTLSPLTSRVWRCPGTYNCTFP